jgi:hypothetical protein
VLIVGRGGLPVTHTTFSEEALAVLLRSSLLLYMGAIDKVLHEALSKHFARFASAGVLDNLVDISMSRAYAIAQHARTRTGKGGKIKKRPGHALKAEMLLDIYKNSYLATGKLEQVCAACGRNRIFTTFAEAHPSYTAAKAKEYWSKMYLRRNYITHECDVVRKARAKRVDFHPVVVSSMKHDIAFIKQFGRFLAVKLN